MQESFDFAEEVHPQGLQPLEMEQTAPHLQPRKKSYAMKIQYAYSIKTSRVKEPDFPYHGEQISCTNEVVSFARSLQDLDIEKMLVLYLDAQNKVLGIQVTSGTVNEAVVYPREVIRHALLVAASSIILIHNHPSENPRPSDADIRLTRRIIEGSNFLNLKVYNHIIIAGNKFFSFREEGTVDFD